MFFAKIFVLITLLSVLSACQDDMSPSGEDKRPVIQTGIVGNQVGQLAPDFTVESTTNTAYTLSSETQLNKAVVLYFTMWCPTCDEHMSHLRSTYINNYPDVQFFLVDYVNGSLSNAYSSQLASGYGDITTLVDIDRNIEALYDGTMGTTIVIGSDGIVRMNQDYSDGSKLGQVLKALP